MRHANGHGPSHHGRCVILIDNTNLFVGGQQLSAHRKGIRHSRGHSDPSDPSWRLDFDGLMRCLARGREVHAALMVGSSPAGEESPWEEAASAAGFTAIVREMNARHEEKAVDTELVARGTEIICEANEPMTLVLASGDSDYLPLVDVAHRNGWSVELWAFQSSFSAEGELAKTVDRICLLDDCFAQIGACAFQWPDR